MTGREQRALKRPPRAQSGGVPGRLVAAFSFCSVCGRPRLPGGEPTTHQVLGGGEFAPDFTFRQTQSPLLAEQSSEQKQGQMLQALGRPLSTFEDLWVLAGNIVDIEDIAQVLGFPRESSNWRRKKEESQVPGRGQPSSEQKAIRENLSAVGAHAQPTLRGEGLGELVCRETDT